MTTADHLAGAFPRAPQWLTIACSAALLGTTILATRPALAQSACSLDGAAWSCSGDLSGGVFADGAELTLSDLTANIAPPVGFAGASLHSDEAATLISQMGAFAILTEDAAGIDVLARGGDALVTHHGAITAQNGTAMSVRADNGAVTIRGSGEINAGLTGISADARDGDTRLTWTGAVHSEQSHAIVATADQGGVSVEGSGRLQTGSTEAAIVLDARGYGDDARLEWSGDISAVLGRGILASSDNGGVTVNGDGQIDTALGAVHLIARGYDADAALEWRGDLTATAGSAVTLEAMNGGVSAEGSGTVLGQAGFTLDARGYGGAAMLAWTGDITGTAGHGVWASSANDAASVSGDGDVVASDIGLFVGSTGYADASLTWNGDITSSEGFAARVATSNGMGALTGRGTVIGFETGLSVAALGGAARVTWQGDISSSDGYGIGATSNSSDVTVFGSGMVQGKLPAIYARTDSAGTASVTWEGDLTSSHGSALQVSSATGSAAASGSGTVTGAAVGILAASEGTGDVSVTWEGAIRGAQQAIFASSALGAASVTGAGQLIGGSDAVHVESFGSSGVRLDWSGSITASGNNAVYIASALGAVGSETIGSIEAAGNGILAWSGTDDASTRVDVTHTGSLSAGGLGVQATAGQGTVSVNFDGRLAAVGTGIHAEARGYGPTTVHQTGSLSAGGTGIQAYSFTGGVSVVQNGDLVAGGLGISAHGDSTGDVHIEKSGQLLAGGNAVRAYSSGAIALIDIADGAIESTGGAGLTAISDWSAASVAGDGWVRAATRGISAASNGSGTADITWQGAIIAGTEALHAYSAHSAVAASGSGAVIGGTDAISLRSDGNARVTLNWLGDIRSSGSNGVTMSSAGGSVAATTEGAILSAGGGIYALSDSESSVDRVTVAHKGALGAGGIGIEAKSAVGAVAVDHLGDLTSGSHGIYAESRGAQTVTVAQTGALISGHDAINAYSSNGDVSVHQHGALSAYGMGIRAFNEGPGTIFVGTSGDIFAREDGISARSARGDITVRMTEGDLISSLGTGIYAGNTADSGVVAVEMSGNIAAALDGISARSANGDVYAHVTGAVVAGETGIRVLSEGSGEVGIVQTGDVFAGEDGLFARSATGNATVSLMAGTVRAEDNGIRVTGYGNLAANIAAGAVVIGGEGAAGVLFENGLSSTLTNHGTILNAGGIDDYAVLAAHHETLVQNFGTISGNVMLGPWGGSFNNNIGAVLNTGTIFGGGLDTELVNAGTLSVGGDRTVLTTEFGGGLRATGSSRLVFDLDMVGESSDRIEVAGASALGGALALSFTSLTGGALSFDVLSAQGGLAADDLRLSDNAFVKSEIERLSDGKTLRVHVSELDLAPQGLSKNAREIGSYFNRAYATGGENVHGLAALIASSGSLANGEALIQQLTPTVTLEAASAGQLQAVGFSDALMSCSVPSGLYAPLREASCDWTKIEHSGSERRLIGGGTSTSSSYMASYGMQHALEGSDWRIGAAVGYAVSSTQSRGVSSPEAERVNLGVSLKYAPGPYQLSAALSGSWGELETTRRVNLGGSTETLDGATTLESYNLKLRAAYLIEKDSLYFIPQVDLNTTYVTAQAYTETGGQAALAFDATNSTVLTLSPALEFGTTRRFEDGGVLRAFARIGASFASQGGVAMTGRVASDVSGEDGFTIDAGRERALWTLGAGISAFQVKGWTGEARVNMSFGGDTTEHQASIKLHKAF